jgi:host factor-I protein
VPAGADADATEHRRAIVSAKVQTVQDVFLKHLREKKSPVTIFLINGIKLQGTVDWFDNFSILLSRAGHSQLLYKHTISTIMPMSAVQLFGGESSP